MEIDLNEENYDYESLLNLFSLPNSFDVQDLKVAKKRFYYYILIRVG